jgi:hypothetical protein
LNGDRVCHEGSRRSILNCWALMLEEENSHHCEVSCETPTGRRVSSPRAECMVRGLTDGSWWIRQCRILLSVSLTAKDITTEALDPHLSVVSLRQLCWPSIKHSNILSIEIASCYLLQSTSLHSTDAMSLATQPVLLRPICCSLDHPDRGVRPLLEI